MTDARNFISPDALRYTATPAVPHNCRALSESSVIVWYTSSAPGPEDEPEDLFAAARLRSARSIALPTTAGATGRPKTRTFKPAKRCAANSLSSRKDDHAMISARVRSTLRNASMTANPSFRDNERSVIRRMGGPKRSRTRMASSPSRATSAPTLNGLINLRHAAVR